MFGLVHRTEKMEHVVVKMMSVKNVTNGMNVAMAEVLSMKMNVNANAMGHYNVMRGQKMMELRTMLKELKQK